MLARLLGPADPADPVCLDIGCGTGLHFAAVAAGGHTVIGVDLSADQLRVAAARNPRLVRADAGRLPFAAASVPAVVMTYIHTDVEDFARVIAAAARVLRPGGRLVYLGLHPAYVGPFLDRQDEVERHELRLAAGYGDERHAVDPTGRFPVRSRVGSRSLTLATFLRAFLVQPSLRLEDVVEVDTDMRPWQPPPGDGRVVPWNLAVTARTAFPLGPG
ncbi:class I SAM-dependent methyltransferase [Dactylosporangium cerinum]|uniref:Class I SAM-dependent methyltransferase n=1 Tax=Dactylosporangium cerinum TaxID=1434730 RepID=A0ABV9W6V0_9ACTN